MNGMKKDAVVDSPAQATSNKNNLFQCKKIGVRKKSREKAVNSGTKIDMRMALFCHILTKAKFPKEWCVAPSMLKKVHTAVAARAATIVLFENFENARNQAKGIINPPKAGKKKWYI